jgi:hypothetical protein
MLKVDPAETLVRHGDTVLGTHTQSRRHMRAVHRMRSEITSGGVYLDYTLPAHPHIRTRRVSRAAIH